MGTLVSGAGGGGESLRAPINHCNNRPISRYLQTREHVFDARTTPSVLTHLDSSTFARPLWAKNIKISLLRRRYAYRCGAVPAVTLTPPNSWSLRDIFILFAHFRGFSEIRAGDVIICPRTPAFSDLFSQIRRVSSHPVHLRSISAMRRLCTVNPCRLSRIKMLFIIMQNQERFYTSNFSTCH